MRSMASRKPRAPRQRIAGTLKRDPKLAAIRTRRKAEQRNQRMRSGNRQITLSGRARSYFERNFQLARQFGFGIENGYFYPRVMLIQFRTPGKFRVAAEIANDAERVPVFGDAE